DAVDLDVPAGEPGGEPDVLSLAADGQRELVVRDDHARDLLLPVELQAGELRRAQRVGDQVLVGLAPADDVDLLAVELVRDGLDAGAADADAGADAVHALVVAVHGDLGAVARLARDAADLDHALRDLGHLQLRPGA